MKKALLAGALLALGMAFAAPNFVFVKDTQMNAMMMKSGDSETIEIAAYPDIPLLARAVTGQRGILIFTSKNQAEDAKTLFAFYTQGFKDEGWTGGDDAMMAGDKMKSGDAMSGDAMKKEGDATKKDGAMADKGNAMMKKGLESTLKMGDHTLTIRVRPYGETQVQVDLILN